MSTYLYEMHVAWDGTSGVVDFDAPEGTIPTANVVVAGLQSSSGIPYTPPYQIIDNIIRVTIGTGSTSIDGSNNLIFTISQSKGFQDSTGNFVAGNCTTLPSNAQPTLNVDQSVVGQVKFNFGIPAGEKGKDGKSAFQIAQDQGWTGSDFAWLQSLKGANGTNGKSAYEVALANGFTGTEAQWLSTLKGAKGDSGMNAYQIAVGLGFNGTLQQWLDSLKGTKGIDGSNGKSAYEMAKDAGFTI